MVRARDVHQEYKDDPSRPTQLGQRGFTFHFLTLSTCVKPSKEKQNFFMSNVELTTCSSLSSTSLLQEFFVEIFIYHCYYYHFFFNLFFPKFVGYSRAASCLATWCVQKYVVYFLLILYYNALYGDAILPRYPAIRLLVSVHTFQF